MSGEPSPLIVALAILSVVLSGMAISFQAPINAALNRSLGDPVMSAGVSFGVGFVFLVVVWLGMFFMRGEPLVVPDLAQTPWWVWIGGFLGTSYVLATIWSVPRIGVVTLVAAAVLGQLLAATIIDAIGAFGLEAKQITPTRILAVVLVMAGLVLSRV